MSTAIIEKSFLSGSVQAPSSKSVAHRIMICAALTRSKCYIKNVSESNDMDATMGCLETLGAKFRRIGKDLFLDATDFVKENDPTHYTLNCKESGTTLRVIIPICAALGLNVTFVGEGRLPYRPLDEYTNLFPKHGVNCTMGESFLPLTISGKLSGDTFEISPTVSSQYVTGMLLALSLLKNDATLKLTSPLVGGQYVDLTVDSMKKFCVDVEKTENSFFIKGDSTFTALPSYSEPEHGVTVEGDWSQAAFFLCAGAINGDITVTGIDINSSQGDKAIVDILKSFGADITTGENFVHVKKSTLKGTVIDATDTPDLVPVVALTAVFCLGNTEITGVERLKFKESDRLLSTCEMIKSLGGDASYTDNSILVTGQGYLTGGNVTAYNDHRIVMSSCVGALLCENNTVIEDAHAVNKSYKDFFDDYVSLGGKADVNMG
ncbi:MAG: 3-phosphoshikimate 1-carboxyvinyltransferase [Ruminococcus sp.]|nr:3-phosphoshikimate 1-carboxyvinyltransferase [Ruminococcus sp.]